MIVVSDTSPLNYLVLIGQESVLQVLYGRVLIPSVVRDELLAVDTPTVVREWISAPPAWIEIRDVAADGLKLIPGLDAGELAAMDLTVSVHADLVLIDDLRARQEAIHRGLKVSGLIGVLMAAAVERQLDIRSVLARLRSSTSFRFSQELQDRAVGLVDRQLGVKPTPD